MSNVSTHYWPFPFPAWLGGPPDGWDHKKIMRHVNHVIPDDWHEPVVDRQLSSGLRLVAERCGLMKYDFSAWPPGVSTSRSDNFDFDQSVEVVMRRLKIMNIYLLLSHIAHLEVENLATETGRLSHFDLVHIAEDGKSMGGPGLMRMPIVVQTSDVARSQAISALVLEHSADLLDAVLLSSAHDIVERLDLLHLGLSMFQQHDYAQALVAGWTVCEQLLADRWHSYIAARSEVMELSDRSTVQRVNSERRRKLQGSDYSIATVLEILELAGELEHQLFRRLHKIRDRRNRWLHRLDNAGSDVASDALNAATKLLGEATGLSLRIGPSISIAGA